MPGKFSLRKFSEINLDDPFFATLKNDYPGNAWRHPCATVFYLPETEKRLTIIKFSISKASLTKNPIPNTGRTISGKDSDEVIQQFGASLT